MADDTKKNGNSAGPAFALPSFMTEWAGPEVLALQPVGRALMQMGHIFERCQYCAGLVREYDQPGLPRCGCSTEDRTIQRGNEKFQRDVMDPVREAMALVLDIPQADDKPDPQVG